MTRLRRKQKAVFSKVWSGGLPSWAIKQGLVPGFCRVLSHFHAWNVDYRLPRDIFIPKHYKTDKGRSLFEDVPCFIWNGVKRYLNALKSKEVIHSNFIAMEKNMLYRNHPTLSRKRNLFLNLLISFHHSKYFNLWITALGHKCIASVFGIINTLPQSWKCV